MNLFSQTLLSIDPVVFCDAVEFERRLRKSTDRLKTCLQAFSLGKGNLGSKGSEWRLYFLQPLNIYLAGCRRSITCLRGDPFEGMIEASRSGRLEFGQYGQMLK